MIMNEEQPNVSGTILSIVLKNFMCHDNLVVNLKSGINVIHGPNGSGKSAILAGLTFIFCSRASVTSRASCHKEFIKMNRKSASVTIYLSNLGKEPYKPSIYGNRIGITRKVSQSGITSFKVLDDQEKVITQKREELYSILEHFCINVDNPINILNQENSKAFLTSSNPKVKYKLFMRATNLQDILDHYDQTKTYLTNIQSDLNIKMEAMVELSDRVGVLSTKIKIIDEMENINEKIRSLEKRITSRQIIELQEGKESIVHSKLTEKEKLINLEDKSQQLQESILQAKHDYKSAVDNFNSIEDRFMTENSKCVEMKSREEQIKGNIRTKSIEINRIEAEIQSTKMLLNDQVKMIQSKHGVGDDFANKKLHHSNLIQELESKKLEYTESVTTFQKQISEIENDISATQSNIASTNQAISNYKRSIIDKNEKIDKYLNFDKDKLSLYGSFTSQLKRKIEEEHKKGLFERCPLGPIGALVNVTDSKWCLPVELCLKSFLNSYVVFSFKDKNHLGSIFKQICPNGQIPPIQICAYNDYLYDVRLNSPKTIYKTILDVITCPEVNILNILIDCLSIERILCVDSVTEARNLMIPSPPKNVSKTYTPEGDEIISVNNQPRFYSSQSKYAKFLSQDYKSAIQLLEDERRSMEIELRNLNNSKLKEQQTLLTELKSKKSQLVNEVHARNQAISHLNTDLEKNIAQLESMKETDLSELQKEADLYREMISDFQSKIDDKNENLNELRETSKQLRQNILDLETNIINIEHDSMEMEKTVKKNERELSVLERKSNDISDEMSKIKQKIKGLEEKIEAEDNQINSLRASLNQDLINEETPAKELQNELKRMKATAKNINLKTDEIKMIKNEYETVFSTYKNQETKKLNKMIEKRQKKYIIMRDYLSKTTQFRFKSLLESRGYDGSLIFDHDALKLLISVNPNHAEKAKLEDSKSLSGGERSFSTLCLIASLWEIIDCPFRCLDEFDVFMDVINRRTGLKLLCQYSEYHPDQQIILITPLDITDRSSRTNINVFKLDAPR